MCSLNEGEGGFEQADYSEALGSGHSGFVFWAFQQFLYSLLKAERLSRFKSQTSNILLFQSLILNTLSII